MNIAVIDDLPEERENIRHILADYASASRVSLSVSAFSSAEELLADDHNWNFFKSCPRRSVKPRQAAD